MKKNLENHLPLTLQIYDPLGDASMVWRLLISFSGDRRAFAMGDLLSASQGERPGRFDVTEVGEEQVAFLAVWSSAWGVLSDAAAPLYLHGVCVNHKRADGKIVTRPGSPLRSSS